VNKHGILLQNLWATALAIYSLLAMIQWTALLMCLWDCRLLGISNVYMDIFCHSVQNLPSASLLRTNIDMNLCRTTSLPVVLYGRGTCSLTLREEHRGWCVRTGRWVGYLGLRGTTTGEWRKLHNEELNDIIRLIKSRRMRWAGLVARMGRGEVRIGIWWWNLRASDH
jgi:hypothetical protein